MSDLINDFLRTDFDGDKQKIKDILDTFREQTKIEKVKGEQLVVNEIIKGTTHIEICRLLEGDNPGKTFVQDDIKQFLERNRDIVKTLEKNKNILTRRHLNAITQVEEELGGLYLFTKKMLKKFEAEGDNSATLGAIGALNKTLVNFAKLKGFGAFAPKEAIQTNIEINVGEKRNAKTLEANFKLVKDGEISEEQKGDSTILQDGFNSGKSNK